MICAVRLYAAAGQVSKMSEETIRSCFPIFSHNKNLVYLDNAATSQKPEAVVQRIERYYSFENANIHRGNYPLSNRASEEYDMSKETVRSWIGAESSAEIVYTKSSTEAVNLAAFGLEPYLDSKQNIVTTELEHSSNFFPWKELCRRTGAQLRIAKAEPDGFLKTESVLEQIDTHTKLLAITGMSNVTGYCPDLERIIPEAHRQGALVFVDATQMIVHHPLSVKDLGCDLLSFSSHKIYGPMGLGVLYGKRELLEKMRPLLYGGDMVMRGDEDKILYKTDSGKFEGGTQNIAAALGLQAALDFLKEHHFEKLLEQEQALAVYTREELKKLPHIHLLNPQIDSPILIFETDRLGAYDVGTLLGLKNIAVRCGSHCAYPLMKRMNRQSICRVSFAVYNTKEDADKLIAAAANLVK